MSLRVVPRAANALIVMRASGSSRPISPPGEPITGSDFSRRRLPRKSGCRLNRKLACRPTPSPPRAAPAGSRIGLSTLYRSLEDLRTRGAARGAAHGPWASALQQPENGSVGAGGGAARRDAGRVRRAVRGAAPGGGAVLRRSAAPCGGSTCHARPIAPGRRAGPPGRGRGAGGVACGPRRDRAERLVFLDQSGVPTPASSGRVPAPPQASAQSGMHPGSGGACL